MTPIRTHNAYHLGDNLVHLNFLRRAALANPDREFVHACAWQYLPQMRELVSDVPNLRLAEFNYLSASNGSIDAWRGSGGCWYRSPIRNDFVRFHIEHWFPHLSNQMRIESPIKSPDDMLFDSSAIRDAYLPSKENHFTTRFPIPFDVLVINSAPQSGQFYGFDKGALNGLVWILLNAGKRVIATAPVPGLYDDAARRMIETPCTANYNLSVTAIGHLSLYCKSILMIATGPCWTTFNVWNRNTIHKRIILLDTERVNLAPNTVHCMGIPAAALEMQKAGII